MSCALSISDRRGYTEYRMATAHTDLSDIVALLKRADFFMRLLPDDLYWLASKSELVPAPAGTVLFRPGDKALRFFIVRSGAIVVSRIDASGRTEEMARFVEGDVLGDFDFSRGASYDAMAASAEDAEILVFPGRGQTMDDLARERPDVAARILLRSVAMISARVRSTQRLISENAPWVRELRRQMYTDAATGLWSRAFLEEELSHSIEPPAAVVLCKPDHFKELCDGWTHAAGDFAMLRIGSILKDEARSLRNAWAIRLRSNETAVIASACGHAEALALAERIAGAYSRIDLAAVTSNQEFHLSASIAIASWPADASDLRELVDQTYGLLLRAWKDGGARIYSLAGSTVAAPDTARSSSS